MKKKWTVLMVAALAMLASPAMAEEQVAKTKATADGSGGADAKEGDAEGGAVAEAEIEAEEEAEPFPIGGSVSVGGTFGAASLISNSRFTQTDFFQSSVGLGLSYKATDWLSLSLGLSYSKFLTEDGSVEKREGRLGDTRLGLGFKGYKDEDFTGVNIRPSLSFSFPTSDASINQRRLLSARGGVSFSRSFGGLSLGYSFGLSKNFHQFTSPVQDVNALDIFAREGGAENVSADLVAEPGVLTSFSLSNSFSLSFGFLDDFGASVSLGFSDSFTYDNGTITERDEFTPANAVVGRGHRQGMSGSLGLSYSATDWLGFSASASTSGAPLASDNRSLRFPFWDLENGISARTFLSMGASASF